MLPRDPAFTDELQGHPPGPGPNDDGPRPPPRGTAPRGPAVLALAGALVGALFSALSTTDFMQLRSEQDLAPLLDSLGVERGAMIPIHALVDASGWLRCVRVGAIHEQDYAAVKAVLGG